MKWALLDQLLESVKNKTVKTKYAASVAVHGSQAIAMSYAGQTAASNNNDEGEQEGDATSGVTDMVPSGQSETSKEKIIRNELRKFKSMSKPALRIKLENMPHDLKDFIGKGGIVKVRNGYIEYYPFSMQYVSPSAQFADIKKITSKISSSTAKVEGNSAPLCKIANGLLGLSTGPSSENNAVESYLNYRKPGF